MINNIYIHPAEKAGERTFYDSQTGIVGRLIPDVDDHEEPITTLVVNEEDCATACAVSMSIEMGKTIVADNLR